MKSKKIVKMFTTTLASVFVALSVQAQTTIYNNGVFGNDTGSFINMGGNQIVGQQILPALGSTPYLYNFNFEYYSSNTFASGDVKVNVQFYNNLGAPFNSYPTPSTKFFDSGWIDLTSPQNLFNDPFATVAVWDFQWQDLYGGAGDINDPFPYTPTLAMNTQLQLPSTFTVVFSFTGIDPGNNFGLEMFYPTGTGNNFDAAYWVNSGTEASPIWGLYTNSASLHSGIGMQMSGVADPVPEPTVIAMGVMGGLLMTHLIRRRKV